MYDQKAIEAPHKLAYDGSLSVNAIQQQQANHVSTVARHWNQTRTSPLASILPQWASGARFSTSGTTAGRVNIAMI